MRAVLLVLFAIIASAVAFMPRNSFRAASTTAKSMTMKYEFKPANIIPAAILPFLIPVAAMAAEGTGRAFGIDDPRLIAAALAPSLLIFPLYNKWSSEQETDDFFDGYEKRRNG